MSEFPHQLGRYQIVKHLADGGMAQVLLARATGIEGFSRHVVIKRIHGERAKDPTFVRMFIDEARLAAALHHAHIVPVHDIGEQSGEYFFEMEYVHGEDARRLLMHLSERQLSMPIEHAVMIVTASAAALHYAHELRGPNREPMGLVHRDVSPANILIGYDGTVKMADFGIAKAAHRSTETLSGMLKGKVAYMAPEQCSGKSVDRRSDVFALGVVLYELLTVRRLFKGENDFLTMTAIVQGNIPKPSKWRADLPTALEAIVLKALAQEPRDRYQSAEEMRAALEKFADDTNLRTSAIGLARFMQQMFGTKPEPWLTDDELPEMTVVDFDGSASGLVAVSSMMETQVLDALDTNFDAPIARARIKAITGAPPLGSARAASAPIYRPAPPPFRAPPPSGPLGAQLATTPTTAPPSSLSIMPDVSSSVGVSEWPHGTDSTVQPTAARRRGLWIGALVLGLVIAVVAAITLRGSGTPSSPSPPTVPAQAVVPVEPPAPATVTAPAADPVTEPVIEPVAPVPVADPPPIEDASPSAGSAKPPPPVKKRTVNKKKPAWNPDELFPE